MQPQNLKPPQKSKVTFTYQSAPSVVSSDLNKISQPSNIEPPSYLSSQLISPSLVSQNIQQQEYQDFLIPTSNYGYNQMGYVNQNYGYAYNQIQSLDAPTSTIQLLKNKDDKEQDKVVAVIVSFVCGSSYDSLFTSVQQKSQEGTRVLVYSCGSSSIDLIHKQLKGEPSNNEDAKKMVNHIREVDPDCVVFNWECSSGYGPQNFPEGKNILFDFVKFLIAKGHMVMFSDFSLKALINQWDNNQLGPNPFKKVGETSNPFELHFDNKKLSQCPSAQLQTVGEMADGGKCHVEAMGGTIVYSVNKQMAKNDDYKLEILTIAETDCQIEDKDYVLEVNGKKGAAGHILLTYKSGGHLLTSMGHWIQLMKIDTSEQKLFQVAQKQYGYEYAQNMKQQYAQMDYQEQQVYVNSSAVRFVQNSQPCMNMASKKYK